MTVNHILIKPDVYIHVGNRHVFIHDYSRPDRRNLEDARDNYGLFCHYEFFAKRIAGMATRTEDENFEIYDNCSMDVEMFPWPTSVKVFFKKYDRNHLTFNRDDSEENIKVDRNGSNLIITKEKANERYEITPDGNVIKIS